MQHVFFPVAVKNEAHGTNVCIRTMEKRYNLKRKNIFTQQKMMMQYECSESEF